MEPVPIVKPEMRPVNKLVAPVHIDIDRDRLSDAEIGQLRFLEICIDPDFRDRANRHQALASDHIVARIDVAAGDDAVDLGIRLCVTEVELGVVQVVLGLQQIGLGLFDGWRFFQEFGEDAVDVMLGIAFVELGEHFARRKVE